MAIRPPSWHPSAHAYQRFGVPNSSFWCDTTDGVRLAGSMLGRADDIAVVFAHGFMGYRSKPRIRLIAEHLAQRYRVFTFDLRGHGESGGACTGGDREALDVNAVALHARRRGFRRVVTLGASLGGIAVIREAALFGASDAVVSMSAPAQWGGTTKPVKRISWLFRSSAGRTMVHRLAGTRLAEASTWGEPDPPIALIGMIAPTPLLLIHGTNDHFFPSSDAEALYESAGDPKRLLLLDGFGHAEDGFTPAFAERLSSEIARLV